MGLKEKKHRLFLADILRVICAILIYTRHSITMYGCTYSQELDGLFKSLTSPVMTCFFILSGFSIHYQYRTEDISNEWTRKFLKKRLIAIMPSYLLVAVIWPLAFPAQLESWVLLLPVDLLGIQTSYRTLFGILHNGGTWFVSCMLLAYIVYPIIKSVLGSGKKRYSILLLSVTHFILMYSNLIIPKFSLDGLYSNPIARAAEFVIGTAFAELVFAEKASAKEHSPKSDWKAPLLIIICLSSISIQARSRIMENSKLLFTLSSISYQFFLAQLFLWNLTTPVMKLLGLSGNVPKILTSFILCILLSYSVWILYDKPVRKLLNRKILNAGEKHE